MLNLDMDLLRTYHNSNPNNESIDVAKKVVDAVLGNGKPLKMHQLLYSKHFIDNLMAAYRKEIEYHTSVLASLNDYLGPETKDAIGNTMTMIDELDSDNKILLFVKKMY